MRYISCVFIVLVFVMAGCGGGGGSSGSTTMVPPDMTSHPIALGTAVFETNINLLGSSRNLSNNNSNFFHGAGYTMAGFGARTGQTLAVSFSNAAVDGIPTIRMNENFGGGTVETYDLACASDGAIYNLQAAGRTGDNFTITGNATTPPIFLPGTISAGATWTGGFTQTGAMSLISVSATGPASGFTGEIHVRLAAAPGGVQQEFYLKVDFGFTDQTANSDVDGFKTNLSSSG